MLSHAVTTRMPALCLLSELAGLDTKTAPTYQTARRHIRSQS